MSLQDIRQQQSQLAALNKEIKLQEAQRKQNTADYALKIKNLTVIFNDLTEKCNNLQNTIEDATVQRHKLLDEIEAQNLQTKEESEKIITAAKTMYQEAQAKMDQIVKLESELKGKSEYLEIQQLNNENSMTDQKTALDQKRQAINEMEIQAKEQEQDAQDKIGIVSAKLDELRFQKEKFVANQAAIQASIVEQRELKIANQKLKDEVIQHRAELLSIDNKTKAERRELDQLRADLDRTTTQLAKRKSEIDLKEGNLINLSVKSDLSLQQMKDKEKDLQYQIGKLNELKSNIEVLIQKQEASKQGA